MCVFVCVRGYAFAIILFRSSIVFPLGWDVSLCVQWQWALLQKFQWQKISLKALLFLLVCRKIDGVGLARRTTSCIILAEKRLYFHSLFLSLSHLPLSIRLTDWPFLQPSPPGCQSIHLPAHSPPTSDTLQQVYPFIRAPATPVKANEEDISIRYSRL